MIQIADQVFLDEKDIEFQFVRASGPGGQNVNKVSTAVQLRFDAAKANLPEDVLRRLTALAGSRMTGDGVLIIEARQFRTQDQNRQDALDRLVKLLWEASQKPRLRKKTRISAEAKKRRMEAKRRRSETKRMRSWSLGDEP